LLTIINEQKLIKPNEPYFVVSCFVVKCRTVYPCNIYLERNKFYVYFVVFIIV